MSDEEILFLPFHFSWLFRNSQFYGTSEVRGRRSKTAAKSILEQLDDLRREHGFNCVGLGNNSPSESHARYVTVLEVFVEGGLADTDDDG